MNGVFDLFAQQSVIRQFFDEIWKHRHELAFVPL